MVADAHARRRRPFRLVSAATVLAAVAAGAVPTGAAAGEAPTADNGRVAAGGVLRINVPEAFGGKTVIGQLTVDHVVGAGYVTAYGCAEGVPTTDDEVTRSDLNYDGAVSAVASNRLIVEADDNGDICFTTLRPAALIVDVNGVTFDTGITSFANRRTDTRSEPDPLIAPGGVLRVNVAEALGGKTVVGQLTVDRVGAPGYVTAYACDDGIPTAGGDVGRSDLNYDPAVAPVASNRLVVQADADGDVCFFTLAAAALIVDINGVADVGIESFPNERTDTRAQPAPMLAAGGVLRVNVGAAIGGRTVIGQLSADRAIGAGYVTAYGCDDGVPRIDGRVSRSDLNYDSVVSQVASNRLIVRADADGDVCFLTSRPTSLIVDVNAVSEFGISSFPNRRTDTRTNSPGPGGPTIVDGVPVWPPYEPLGRVPGVAALTGLPTRAAVTRRPILAVKIDNYSRARPQWGLDRADVVIEENVEGVTRFIALFHTDLPDVVGPVRSARTGDLDLLTAMNRPVFAYSGANAGVMEWIDSASRSGLLVDHNAQRRPCYNRSSAKPGPHNLLLDPACAVSNAIGAGPARPLFTIDAAWTPPAGLAATRDTAFRVTMDGVLVEWAWDPVTRSYLRSQDGAPHVTDAGRLVTAHNVVEIESVHVPSTVDARSPNPITVGTGAAVVHRDGVAIPAIWSRASGWDQFELFDPVTGVPIVLDTGRTFVELTRAG